MPDTSAQVLLVYVLSSRTAYSQLLYISEQSGRTFISQHQCNSQKPELASNLSLHSRIEFLQPVDEHQSQEDNILRDLSHRKYGCHPFAKPGRRHRFR